MQAAAPRVRVSDVGIRAPGGAGGLRGSARRTGWERGPTELSAAHRQIPGSQPPRPRLPAPSAGSPRQAEGRAGAGKPIRGRKGKGRGKGQMAGSLAGGNGGCRC